MKLMSKKYQKIWKLCALMVIFVLLISIALIFFYKEDNFTLAKNNLSEQCVHYYEDVSGSSVVRISTGFREEPYILDGIHCENVEYTLLVFKTDKTVGEAVNFKVTIDDEEFTGVLEQNPYDSTYVCDLKKCIAGDCEIKVTITIGVEDFIFAPKNLSSTWVVGLNDALKIGFDNLKKTINNISKSGTFNGECYLKVIFDTQNRFNEHFYYISIIDRNGKTNSIVLDTFGTILSKNY